MAALHVTGNRRGGSIISAQDIDGDGAVAASLLFAADARPSVGHLETLASREGGFSVSLSPSEAVDGIYWAELLINGMTFDIIGIAPGPGAPLPPVAHSYGVEMSDKREAVVLRPGPHLAGGAAMTPVVRMLALLGARLTGLAGVEAVAWHPARCQSAPGPYRAGVSRWIEGGPFPALSLAALVEQPGGALRSEGLALLTGQEVELEPTPGTDSATAAKTVLRLIDWLVSNGALSASQVVTAADGRQLALEPSDGGRLIRARET